MARTAARPGLCSSDQGYCGLSLLTPLNMALLVPSYYGPGMITALPPQQPPSARVPSARVPSARLTSARLSSCPANDSSGALRRLEDEMKALAHTIASGEAEIAHYDSQMRKEVAKLANLDRSFGILRREGQSIENELRNLEGSKHHVFYDPHKRKWLYTRKYGRLLDDQGGNDRATVDAEHSHEACELRLEAAKVAGDSSHYKLIDVRNRMAECQKQWSELRTEQWAAEQRAQNLSSQYRPAPAPGGNYLSLTKAVPVPSQGRARAQKIVVSKIVQPASASIALRSSTVRSQVPPVRIASRAPKFIGSRSSSSSSSNSSSSSSASASEVSYTSKVLPSRAERASMTSSSRSSSSRSSSRSSASSSAASSSQSGIGSWAQASATPGSRSSSASSSESSSSASSSAAGYQSNDSRSARASTTSGSRSSSAASTSNASASAYST